MARNVTVQIQGQAPQTIPEANNVGELRTRLEVTSTMTAMVNGFVRNDDFSLRDQNFVTFTQKSSHGGALK